MFTGLVHEVGTITGLRYQTELALLDIHASKLVAQGIRLGDSVSVNGICLTVSGLHPNGFSLQAMHETLRHTTIKTWRQGMQVNLEPALALGGRLDGHMVSGHVDGTASVITRSHEGAAIRVELKTGKEIFRYLARKGSVAADGVSLTIADIFSECRFALALIPYTLSHTTLGQWLPGLNVNIEVDLIARYLERLLPGQAADGLTQAKLAEYGY